MARIKAFSGIRPRKGLEARIAALPYDVYSREEAKIQVDGTVSHIPRDRCLTPHSPQLHNSVTISYADKAPISWHPG